MRDAIRAALSKAAWHQVETNWSLAGPIPDHPDGAGGAVVRDVREISVAAPDGALFGAVCRVGGGHGWYAADWTRADSRLARPASPKSGRPGPPYPRRISHQDRLRFAGDSVEAGGPGLRRGRRYPELVSCGEALDCWRVTGLECNRRLARRAEMKLPGEALRRFRIGPRGPDACVLRQEALFQPHGLFGLLYGYAVAHVAFRGMRRGIAREALRLAASGRR